MTSRKKRRPSVLLVALPKATEGRLLLLLRGAGFDVVRTKSRAAALVYGNELMPDLVLCTADTARVLCGCYPDGPLWIRAELPFDDAELSAALTVLRGAHASPDLRRRLVDALSSAHIAA